MTTGHVELGEEYDKAAVREVKEELGIEIKEEDLISLAIFKQSVKSSKAINNSFMKYYFYKTNKKIEDYIIQLEELSEIKYISFNEIERIINEKDENYVLAKKEIMQDILKLLKAYK